MAIGPMSDVDVITTLESEINDIDGFTVYDTQGGASALPLQQAEVSVEVLYDSTEATGPDRSSQSPGQGQIVSDTLFVNLQQLINPQDQATSRATILRNGAVVRTALRGLPQPEVDWQDQRLFRGDDDAGAWFRLEQTYEALRVQELVA